MSPFANQIVYALNSLFSPLGLLAISAFVLLLVLALLFKQLKWILLGFMLFASTLTLHSIEGTPNLMFPLEQLRTQGRAITVGLIFIMTAATLSLPRGWRHKYFVPGFALFLVFQLILSLNITLRNDFARGSGGLLLNLFVFFLFGIAIPHALQSWDDIISYVRGLAGFGTIFAGINFIQIVVKPSAVVASRFTGTTNNAQLVGQICALTLLPVCYMLVRPGKGRLERPILGVTAALLVIMLTWSGSRTGAMMAVLGLAFMFRARLNRLAIAAVVIGLFALVTAKIVFPEKQIISEHLFSTGNSRSWVWTSLLQEFLSQPIVGVMTKAETGYGESSYLSVAANVGLMGFIPFIIALAMIAYSLNRLRKFRYSLGDPLLADMVTASLVACAFGAIFEDYLLGILSFTLMMGMASMPILAYLLECAQTPEVQIEEAVPTDTEFAGHVPAAF